jgi:hypothetical protein
MGLICAISSVRVSVPDDLRPAEARQSVLMAVQELERRFPDGLPKLDPIEVREYILSFSFWLPSNTYGTLVEISGK